MACMGGVNLIGTIVKDMGSYKNEFLSPILNSDDIKDIMLVGEEYSDDMWYGIDDDDGIVYRQIFPYLYIDETQTQVNTYICFETDIPNIPTATIKDMKLIVWCLCHKRCMKYSKNGYSGTRADILADAVERTLRQAEADSQNKGRSKFGIGKLHLESVTYMASQYKDYYGRQMIFTVPDFKIG